MWRQIGAAVQSGQTVDYFLFEGGIERPKIDYYSYHISFSLHVHECGKKKKSQECA